MIFWRWNRSEVI